MKVWQFLLLQSVESIHILHFGAKETARPYSILHFAPKCRIWSTASIVLAVSHSRGSWEAVLELVIDS
jgi:hypothetical protein